MIKKLVFTMIIVAMLTGCATHKEAPEIPVASKSNEYSCEAGDILTIGKVIVSTEPEQAVLRLGREEYALSRVRSASGAKYANQKVIWWSKGKEATLQFEGIDELLKCNLK
ncbi:MAG: lysozyme inhibitor [Proteobacteria bacterium]|nr:lysozyme inhibitor [Pseudomonadota bacterium]